MLPRWVHSYMDPAFPSFLLPDEIHVRVMQLRDTDEFLAAVHESVDEVGKWLPWCVPGYSYQMAESWITHCRQSFINHTMYEFGIFQGGVFAGGVGINQLDPPIRAGNLGYWLRSSKHGNGIMTQVARRVAQWALTDQEFKRVSIVAALENAASRRVAEKIGAQFEGVARNGLNLHGEWLGAAQYSLIPSDLE